MIDYKKWSSLHTKIIAPSLIEIGPVVLQKGFLKFVNVIAMPLLSPHGKMMPLHLNKLESSSPKNALSQVWLKLASGPGEFFFKICK